ncbi:hypothetical protein Acr_00g0034730 [Actinidia rufa]|uniref:Uncharacterized protein n=1 Tax=Actinidia rufa TaxID=165716 RepID=A0A7J0DHY6_9ERIC|nr:hypothetical protein Acr_00g0034730 [Actinidia rufa]
MKLKQGALEPAIRPKPTAFKRSLLFGNRRRGQSGRRSRNQIGRSFFVIGTDIKREVICGAAVSGMSRGERDFVCETQRKARNPLVAVVVQRRRKDGLGHCTRSPRLPLEDNQTVRECFKGFGFIESIKLSEVVVYNSTGSN